MVVWLFTIPSICYRDKEKGKFKVPFWYPGSFSSKVDLDKSFVCKREQEYDMALCHKGGNPVIDSSDKKMWER